VQGALTDRPPVEDSPGALAGFRAALADVRKGKVGDWLGYVFIAPAVLLFLIFQGYPLIRGLLMAFSDYRWLVPETQGLLNLNGFENFRAMLRDEQFVRSFAITLRYTLVFLPLLLIISLGCALLIYRVRNAKLAAFYRVVAYIPVVLPVSVSMMMWRQIYDQQYGILNQILSVFGLRNPPLWLSDPGLAMWAVLMPDLWLGFGYFTLLFLIGLYNIDGTLFEAAAIDGANGWQQVRHVTLPLLKPITTLVLIGTGGLASATVAVMTLFRPAGGPGEAMMTIGLYGYKVAFQIGDMRMGYSASMALVIGIYSMIFTAIVFKLLRTERA
jgi:ABC-type sugar transport system permease subunit